MTKRPERVDLQAFKQKLKVVLKENNKEYWDCLRRFCQAKLTKSELDTYARSVLGSEENGSRIIKLVSN
jgi:hypothetical protein